MLPSRWTVGGIHAQHCQQSEQDQQQEKDVVQTRAKKHFLILLLSKCFFPYFTAFFPESSLRSDPTQHTIIKNTNIIPWFIHSSFYLRILFLAGGSAPAYCKSSRLLLNSSFTACISTWPDELLAFSFLSAAPFNQLSALNSSGGHNISLSSCTRSHFRG